MARVVQGATSTTVDLPSFLRALKAVRQGDFSARLPDHWTGVAGKVADTFNEVVELNQRLASELERLRLAEQFRSLAAEATRVAREVGTEGKLGGQADVRDVAGTWKDLTDSVNSMAGNLTAQVRNIAEVTTAVANGDLSRKITVDVRG